MGERTPGLETNSAASPRAVVEELGSEVAGVREELDTLLAELDRRRHEALDVRLQLRRHAVGAGLTAFALLATATGSVWLTLWRRQRRDRLGAKASRLRSAIARMTAHPERVAAEPTVGRTIAMAAANAAVAGLVKKLLERKLERLLDTNRHGSTARSIGSRNGDDEAVRSPGGWLRAA
jgi:hypothetical protein